jgi:transcription termination factor NusB
MFELLKNESIVKICSNHRMLSVMFTENTRIFYTETEKTETNKLTFIILTHKRKIGQMLSYVYPKSWSFKQLQAVN